jgi:hypothetical protein
MKNKLPEDMTPEERKEIKIQFAPGAFDSFEGSQEELNELMADIQKMILDGSLFEKSKPLDLDELLESDDPADQALAEKLIRSFDNDSNNRNLQ